MIGVTPTYGNWYDRFVGRAIRFATATQDQYGKWHDAKVNHSFIYVGDGQIVEATPKGAKLSNWDSYGSDAIWPVNGIGTRDKTGRLTPLEIDDATLAKVADEARKLVGTPYGFLDLLAVGLAQARFKRVVDPSEVLAEQPWWVRQIEDEHRLICSQLDDTAYKNVGVELLQNIPVPGLVTPADLYGLFL